MRTLSQWKGLGNWKKKNHLKPLTEPKQILQYAKNVHEQQI